MKERSTPAFGDAVFADETNYGVGCGKDKVERMALRPAQVSEALGISMTMVYALIHAKKIPAIRVNNSYLCPVAALEKALEDLIGEELTV